MQAPATRPKIGFVLSGGGSRGAYEAGIIHYLRTDLARRLGRHVPIDIVTGTSVGAINAAFMAATMSDPQTQADQITSAWKALRIEDMISLKAMDALRAARLMLGGDPPKPAPGSFRYGGLLDTGGLERFVIRVIPWSGIERSLRGRDLHAISVSATHVGTGHTVVFLSSAEPVPREWSRDPFVRHRAARIGPRHVLASASIPMLFPAVKIGDEYFTDGGLRQNTPMSPAIRLYDRLFRSPAADRVAAARRCPGAAHGDQNAKPRQRRIPSRCSSRGKAGQRVAARFHTEYDLARMQRINLDPRRRPPR